MKEKGRQANILILYYINIIFNIKQHAQQIKAAKFTSTL